MTQILMYFYILTVLFGGGYLILLGFKIINPKKDNPEQQERMKKWHKKFGNFAKFGGIALVIWGMLNLIYPDLNPFNFEKKQESKNWTQGQKETMIKQVINGSNYLKSINSDTANLVANCFVDKYTKKFSLDDAWKQEELTQEQRMKLALPLMKGCLKQYGLKTAE